MKQKHSWNNQEKSDFLIRVGQLLLQGYTMTEALDLFLKYEKEKLKPMMRCLLKELQNGKNLSEAIKILNIPETISSFIYFAEHYGSVAKGLIDGGTLLKMKEENQRKIQKLLKYPIFMLWILLVFFYIMYQFLFPQFFLLFSSINIELPLITRLFLGFITHIPYLFVTLCFVIGCFYCYYLLFFRQKSPYMKMKLYARIPFVGLFFRLMNTYYFANNLSYLIKNGIPIHDALFIFKNQQDLSYLHSIATILIAKLEAGETLEEALLVETELLKGLAYIVSHGHSNGRLDEELQHYRDWILEEFEVKYQKLVMLIQPSLFAFIGLVILCMFAAILIPIFSIINGI